MNTANKNHYSQELLLLCATVRDFMKEKEYDACFGLICETMERYPDAPHPHNLLGILLEKSGNHSLAMKHFRAAWALDPTYLPARHNLENYGTFYSRGGCAYDESDVTIVVK